MRAATQAALAAGWDQVDIDVIIGVALHAARPVWAGQLAIAVEDAAVSRKVSAERVWYDVAEFIRAREDQ